MGSKCGNSSFILMIITFLALLVLVSSTRPGHSLQLYSGSGSNANTNGGASSTGRSVSSSSGASSGTSSSNYFGQQQTAASAENSFASGYNPNAYQNSGGSSHGYVNGIPWYMVGTANTNTNTNSNSNTGPGYAGANSGTGTNGGTYANYLF